MTNAEEPSSLTDRTATPWRRFNAAALRRLGLKEIKAYTFEQPSGGATRTSRHRQRQLKRGIRQLNVVVPDDATLRASLREAAARLSSEPAFVEVLNDVISRPPAGSKGRRKHIGRLGLLQLGLAFALGCATAPILCQLSDSLKRLTAAAPASTLQHKGLTASIEDAAHPKKGAWPSRNHPTQVATKRPGAQGSQTSSRQGKILDDLKPR